MHAVIFDVETTGLPKKRKARLDEFDNWPYIVQMSWICVDLIDNEITSIRDYIIKTPENITIPEESTKVHGITNEMSKNHGKDLRDVLNIFQHDIIESQIIVAHNIEFDETIIGVESLRIFNKNLFDKYKNKKYCTMRMSRKICKKWLKLELLHFILFKEKPNNLHNSLIDVYVCYRCFYKLYYNKDLLKMDTIKNTDSNKNIEFKNTYSDILCKC